MSSKLTARLLKLYCFQHLQRSCVMEETPRCQMHHDERRRFNTCARNAPDLAASGVGVSHSSYPLYTGTRSQFYFKPITSSWSCSEAIKLSKPADKRPVTHRYVGRDRPPRRQDPLSDRWRSQFGRSTTSRIKCVIRCQLTTPFAETLWSRQLS